MLSRARIATVVLIGLLAFADPQARAADRTEARPADRPTGPVSEAQLDQALATRLHGEDESRATIRRLLQRDDVQKLARGYGLDARRAEASVGTLRGEELQRLAAQAATVESRLAGGDELVIRMSLVAMLLIVIIVILLAQG
jgi:hypothetical protein